MFIFRYLISLLFIVFLFGYLFGETPSRNGGFHYNIYEKTCISGPTSPSGFYSGPDIKIVETKLVGPCDSSQTPSWGTNECCLQVCKTYDSQTARCELKEEYKQMIDTATIPLEEHKKKMTEAANTANSLKEQINTLQSQINSQQALIGFLIIVVLLIYFSKQKS